jgi:hypothetical protein
MGSLLDQRPETMSPPSVVEQTFMSDLLPLPRPGGARIMSLTAVGVGAQAGANNSSQKTFGHPATASRGRHADGARHVRENGGDQETGG